MGMDPPGNLEHSSKGLYPDPYPPESGASAKGGFKETCLLTCYKQLNFLSDT